MFNFVGDHANSTVRQLLVAASFAILLAIPGCHKEEANIQSGPATFASPEEAGRALANAAKSDDQNGIKQIFGPNSADLVSTGNAAQDKDSLNQFSQAYQEMNRWRRLGDGTELLLVGADNQAFPIPLMKNASGQWYFDAAAGKDEILARRIGRDEREASPVKCVSKGCVAAIPHSNRIRVPELPQSTGCAGGLKVPR